MSDDLERMWPLYTTIRRVTLGFVFIPPDGAGIAQLFAPTLKELLELIQEHLAEFGEKDHATESE